MRIGLGRQATRKGWRRVIGLLASVVISTNCAFAEAPIPHNQDAPPGPALSPEEAIARMKAPEGFTVEVVAAEPDLVNPVSMTFDEQGRIWVTESLEYPRMEAGPGRDRVKVLEDTDHDGRVDKVTVFADGLNIPSGIAVGHGGVWVANSPDILLLKDTDGDLKADTREVIVTGFGRHDTHELPNSLTWGPDGWLYGLNGVFNAAHIEHQGKTHDFTVAVFRIHPKTHAFELFAEGTSNPWGIAFNDTGEMFLSACVIDHLWHITETGYYHRQAGAYPPHTWKIESIVDYKHQKAAYCGIHYFDSEAYPAEYRGKLYMGNVHGGCINVDGLRRNGSTYAGTAEPDFLVANDAWFMPVAQKTGPDGCLYILDWYDQYHCYQDARRDPEGIERGRGRLYRVRYKETPRAPAFNLAKETDEQLIGRLRSRNVFFRDAAQQVLAERGSPALARKLQVVVRDSSQPKSARMHALWAIVGGDMLKSCDVLNSLRLDMDPDFRAWAVRAGGVGAEAMKLADDPSPEVRLQTAIAASKRLDIDRLGVLWKILRNSGDDPLIPRIVWRNLSPLLEEQGGAFLEIVGNTTESLSSAAQEVVSRAAPRILDSKSRTPETVARLFAMSTTGPLSNGDVARNCLTLLIDRTTSRELKLDEIAKLNTRLGPQLKRIVTDGKANAELRSYAVILQAAWGDPESKARLKTDFAAPDQAIDLQVRRVQAAILLGEEWVLPEILAAMDQPVISVSHKQRLLTELSRVDSPALAVAIIERLKAGSFILELRPQAVELLLQRPASAKELFRSGAPLRDLVNETQVRRLLASKDAELEKLVTDQWGVLRPDRDPARDDVVKRMREVLRTTPGEPTRGIAVFNKVCSQCHKLFGEGAEVGPELTANGRATFEQLLSNVFDPSLVIGSGYQARTVLTRAGLSFSGLVREDSPDRIVLRAQGGKDEMIPKSEIEDDVLSPLSLMPEGIENQFSAQEIADLFAYLALDKPPTDPTSRPIVSLLSVQPGETEEADRFPLLLQAVAPGFNTVAVGERGLGLLREFSGRAYVLRTHPINRETPCVLSRTVDLPADKRYRLRATVGHDPNGDWQLVIRCNGEELASELVAPSTCTDGWRIVEVDLSRFAGSQVQIELLNSPNGWTWEYGYWSRVELVAP